MELGFNQIKAEKENRPEECAPKIWYHGENTFSYTCGKCGMPIDEKDHFCRWCGVKIKK